MIPARSLVLALACCLSLLYSAPVLAEKKVPREVGGFVLGSDVGDYPDAMNTNFLKEMVITDWHGFRKGVISYGICKYPNKIVRIELKYEDQSKEYFLKLLDEYKTQFGAPEEWKGDSFGILHIWKWFFKDSDNRAISLLLQHNLRNPNESIGNVVKLSYTDMIEEERECFNQMCEEKKSAEDKERLELLKKPDWQFLIPR